MIKDKSDIKAVEDIIAIGYPENTPYLDELLSWTCDPNWPIAGKIYDYFVTLGKNEVARVKNVASSEGDFWWRYNIINNIMVYYDNDTIAECVDWLTSCARQPGTEECDIAALRLLAERKLVDDKEIAKIAKRNLFVYNMYIKETLEIAEGAIYKYPLSEHTL